MAQIEIRAAHAEDRDAVLAFCSGTWEWGDYIDHVWDDWLADQQGALLIATADETPAGLLHLRMLSGEEAWLEGMRVDPTVRQQGIARRLNDAALLEAMRKGAIVARLTTESTNTPAIALVEKNYFQRVGSFVPYAAHALAPESEQHADLERPTLAEVGDLEEIIDYLNVSSIFPLTGGLYYQRGWTGRRITDTLLSEKIAAHEVYLLRRWQRLDGLALIERREARQGDHLFIGYIDGTTESISLLAYDLRRQATRQGLEQVRAHIPELLMVRDAFAGAEYEQDGNPFLTYERSLV